MRYMSSAIDLYDPMVCVGQGDGRVQAARQEVRLAHPRRAAGAFRIVSNCFELFELFRIPTLAVLQMCRDGKSLAEITAEVEAEKAGTVPRFGPCESAAPLLLCELKTYLLNTNGRA
jgi:hypothetical protein